MNELAEIKNFYKTVVFDMEFYPSHHLIAEKVISFNPKSIFEFGAAQGKNWINIRDKLPDATYKGLDINATHTVQAARLGIDVLRGDETSLDKYNDNEFDLVFTSSVINHLPPETAKWTVEQLKRIAKNIVILCESITESRWRWYIHPFEKWDFVDQNVSVKNPVTEKTILEYRLFVHTKTPLN